MNRDSKALAHLDKIKAGPHRRFLLKPKGYDAKRFRTIHDVKAFVASTKVSIIGWDFPAIAQSGLSDATESFFWALTDFDAIQEYWEFHKSGLFVYFCGFSELDAEGQRQLHAPMHDDRPKLSVLAQIYRVTEYMEYCARAASRMQLVDGVDIELSYINVRGCVLAAGFGYNSLFSEPIHESMAVIERTLSYTDAISMNRVVAVSMLAELFAYFKVELRADVIRRVQDDYYRYRLGTDGYEDRFSTWPEETAVDGEEEAGDS